MMMGLCCLSISSCSNGGGSGSDYVSVQLEDSKMWSLLDVSNGKLVMTDEFFAPSSRVIKGSFFVENDNGEFDLYNLKDTKNKLNRSAFSVVTNFNTQGFAIVRVKDEPWQIIDTDGNVKATLDKELRVEAGFSNEGLAKITNKDGMIGYINTKGETQIKPRYRFGTIFSDGVAIVLTKQEEGHNYFSAIDTKGENLFTFSDAKYSKVGLFNQGYLFAVEGDHSVLLDKTGKKVLTVSTGTNLSELAYNKGNIIYYDGQFYGVKNSEDKILIRAKYNSLKFQSDGNLVAQNSNRKYGVITSEDEIITPFDFDMLDYLAPGRYITQSGNVNVLINGDKKEICEKAFSNFSNRSASASEADLSSLISAQNNYASSYNNNSSAFEMNLNNIPVYIPEPEPMPMAGMTGESFGDVPQEISIGEHKGKVDGKNDIVLEITSIDGNKIMGNTYYPSAVAKYDKTGQTLMPFSGTIEDDGFDLTIKLIVKSPTDATYYEDWILFIQDGLAGEIKTSKGKTWTVRFED